MIRNIVKRRTWLFVLILFSLSNHVTLFSQAIIESKIDSILKKLTLDEKIRMCHAQSKFSTRGVPRLGLPEIWMSDGPHGVRAEINWDNWGYAGWTNDSCTAFPSLTCLAATFNPELAYEYGKAIGEEALFREKDILLGPGVNIYRTPLNGRNFEYMGEDPYLASRMVVPYIKGVQENGVAACVKHYILNNQEEDRRYVDVRISDRALREIYLPAFEAAVKEAKVWSLMGSYNKYMGQYCTHNEKLNNILKTEWGFDGVVLSDWGSTHNTVEAALYGLDIEMGTWTDGLTWSEKNAYDNYFLALPFKQKVELGEISEDVLNDKVRRILRLMYRTNMNKERGFGSKGSPEHFEVAKKIGQEGIVLLKNTDNFFPINRNEKMTIAVIGENAIRKMTLGGGSSELKTLKEISPLEGIKNSFPMATIVFSMGYASGPPRYGKVIPSPYNVDSLFEEAIKVAAQADLVLYVGGLNKNFLQDCEEGDRESLNLSFEQDKLIEKLAEHNKNIGVVLVGGNAVAMPWIEKVKGVMYIWYLGSETGNALAGVLTGDVSPSGKLPFSFPVKLEDNPAHAFDATVYPGVDSIVEYKEDILVGYRWHDTKNIPPLFEFGYGLSYTSFEFSSVETNRRVFTAKDTISVLVNIKNTGSMKGAEVVQVYVHDVSSSVQKPLKELKAFQKVFLEKGEEQRLEINIPVSKFSFFNEKKNAWMLEPGEYKLLVGNSSRNILKEIVIAVK